MTEFPVTLEYQTAYEVTSVAAEDYTYEGVELGTVWTLSEDKKTITCEGNAGRGEKISITVPAAVEASTEPIPPLDPTDEKYAEKVAAVVATLNDTSAKKFVNTENYGAFQTWANGVGQEKVVASPESFLCYALGMDDVLTEALTSDDVKITAYNKDTGVIEVAIEGVTPGTTIPAGELAKVLTAVGGETLDGMTAEKVNVSGQCVETGKIQVTVTPKDTTATAFFIKAELVK